MPYSYGEFKTQVRDHIVDNFPKSTRILDVGAGSGTYGNLLKPHYDVVDALEIFPEYISMFDLHSKYTTVHVGNIMQFGFEGYDYLVLGDILEHLTVSDATALMNRIDALGKKVLVAVPYMFEQGTEFGNVYETHHQPDLTVAKMYQRYPSLRLIYGDLGYGYYINYIPPIK